MSIGNANIHQVSEIPEITKLPNGRLRVVRRFNKFTREDVDNANYGSLMGDFGDLDTAGQQLVNQGYTDLQLISVEIDTRFNSVSNNSNAVLVKTYETLTSSFVQVTDEDQIEELENGIKRLTRVFRAQSGTTYSGDVGTTNAGGSLTNFILSKSDLKDSGAFAELTLTFLTTGITDVREDIIGSQKAIVITKVGSEPTTSEASARSDIAYDDSSNWSIARKDVTREGGLQVYTYTFLLDNTVLSQSQDKQGSLKTEVIEVFNPRGTIEGLKLYGGSGLEGDYFKVDTLYNNKNNYHKPVTGTYPIFVSYNAVNSKWEAGQFNLTYAQSDDINPHNPLDPPVTGWTVVTNSYQGWVAEDFEVDNILFTEFDTTVPSSTSGFKFSHRYEKDGYSLISEQISNIDGIPTVRYTFAKNNSIISVSEDKIGSQNAIVNEIFNPTSETITGVDSDNSALSGYSEVDRIESNYDGIKTIRVRFLKPSILSVTQDFVEDINTIQVTAFNKTATEVSSELGEVTTNHKLINQREENHDGISTNTYTFEKNESDVVEYTANNRLQVTRTLYESSGYNYNANYDVGTTTLTFNNTTLTLSALRVNKRGTGSTFVKLEAVFTEPGESSRSETTGPTSMPGTEQVTITSSGSTAITLTETDDIKLINKQQQNNNGFSTFVRSYIKGTDATTTTNIYVSGRTYKVASNGDYSSVGGPSTGIIGDYFQATSSDTLGSGVTAYLVGQIVGDKVTYENIVSVQVPGTVKCKTQDAKYPYGIVITNSYQAGKSYIVTTGGDYSTVGGYGGMSAGDVFMATTDGSLTSPDRFAQEVDEITIQTYNADQSFLEVVPPNNIKIKVNVTESILTSIPTISNLAYNLDDIQCSVTTMTSGVSRAGGSFVSKQVGNIYNFRIGFNRNARFGTKNAVFPGSYLIDNDNSATTMILAGRQYRIASLGTTNFTSIGASSNPQVGEVFTATGTNSGTGTATWLGAESLLAYQSANAPYATSSGVSDNPGYSSSSTILLTSGTASQSNGSPPSSYTTTGTIQQKARPVLTTIDGTTYYEVIKFSKDS